MLITIICENGTGIPRYMPLRRARYAPRGAMLRSRVDNARCAVPAAATRAKMLRYGEGEEVLQPLSSRQVEECRCYWRR